MARTNQSIKSHYETGHDYTSDGREEDGAILSSLGMDSSILEIGCGEGRLAYRMALKFNDVTAMDYVAHENWPDGTEAQISLAGYRAPNYIEADYKFTEPTPFDIVVMKGVLEHMDDPFETLSFIAENFKPNQIITSSPSFLNPRGYIWMALQYLFDYPMSLADLHFILPSQMEKWAEEIGFSCEYTSVDQDWGHGKKLIEDFNKRLPNVFKDIEADVPKFMEWLEQTLPYQNHTEHSGATIVYNLRRK